MYCMYIGTGGFEGVGGVRVTAKHKWSYIRDEFISTDLGPITEPDPSYIKVLKHYFGHSKFRP